MAIDKTIETVKQYGHYSVTGPVKLPLSIGEQVVNFTHDGFRFPTGRYGAIYIGNIKNSSGILMRVESHCQWAFYYGSMLCDCKWQMEEAKRRIVKEGQGLIIFALDQNGKGIPFEDHWLVYAEGQRRGLELVVDAYQKLGFREDYRDYRDVIDIAKHYGLKEVRLLTNNPRKISAFENAGIKVLVRNLEQPINDYLKPEYLPKKRKLGHLLKVPDSALK